MSDIDFESMTEEQKIAAYEKMMAEKHAVDVAKTEEAVEEILAAFKDETEGNIIADLFRLIVEQKRNLNIAMESAVQVASTMEAFYEKLVGDGKLISNEEFDNIAGGAYKRAMEQQVPPQ